MAPSDPTMVWTAKELIDRLNRELESLEQRVRHGEAVDATNLIEAARLLQIRVTNLEIHKAETVAVNQFKRNIIGGSVGLAIISIFNLVLQIAALRGGP